MPTNPSKQGNLVNSAMQRGSRINDPNFSLSTGYAPFDLSHQEMFTSRFAECTPYCHIDTIPADRFVMRNNLKTIHNRIDGNLLSTVNQYDDTFYVSLANLIPNAYERFIPNPTDGDDLPNSALPQVPLAHFCANLLFNTTVIELIYDTDIESFTVLDNMQSYLETLISFDQPGVNEGTVAMWYANAFVMLHNFILSRGQLLDYFGYQPDVKGYSYGQDSFKSRFQRIIDNYWNNLYELVLASGAKGIAVDIVYDNSSSYGAYLTENKVTFSAANQVSISEPYDFRTFVYDCFENGKLPIITFTYESEQFQTTAFRESVEELVLMLREFYSPILEEGTLDIVIPTIRTVDTSANPFDIGFINPLKPLAYQLSIAQYATNDYVDNIYTADLYMQNLRSVMFPTSTNLSQEPIYNYNGVQFEYDLMSYGAWHRSFLTPSYPGSLTRSFAVATLLFVMRRSLRYGDYFSTSRPKMLAVGDLYVNVVDGKVSPIDMTRNTLMQRYLNAGNYLGRRIDSLYAGVYDVIPSDRPSAPRYVSHRKTVLQSQLTNNTSNEQGKQTTNLVGYTDGDNTGIDVFIDDYGVIISIVSYDVLPVYTSGFDRTFSFSDRFDYFNPMLQNIGDQEVKKSELIGMLDETQFVFGYQMRNAELKFKVSRCHGGCVNDLDGYVFRYPLRVFDGHADKIGPEFVRDKPTYFDQLAKLMDGKSPAQYYHFVVSATNEVKSARKMQPTPPILF